MKRVNRVASAENATVTYQGLYKFGGEAAWISAGLILSEVVGFAFYPQPSTVRGWFTLFQSNRFVGLLDFWGLEVPLYVMFAVVFLVLYVLLKRARESHMAIALALALLGIAIFLATNNPFAMLSLSHQYAAATTEAQRATILAAEQALLTNTNQRAVGGFNLGLFLVSVAGLTASWVMLQSSTFSKLTAYVGVVANALSLADYLRQALTTSTFVTLLVILPNTLFLVSWYVLVGRRLYEIGELQRKSLAKQL
jgi:hypothetical protein